MTPMDLVRLTALRDCTSGVVIGLIDGPVSIDHPDLATENVRDIPGKPAEQFARDFSLSGVEVRASPLSGTRKIVDCIFSYTNRNTDFTERFSVRGDITEEFPFLVTKLSPYYDR